MIDEELRYVMESTSAGASPASASVKIRMLGKIRAAEDNSVGGNRKNGFCRSLQKVSHPRCKCFYLARGGEYDKVH